MLFHVHYPFLLSVYLNVHFPHQLVVIFVFFLHGFVFFLSLTNRSRGELRRGIEERGKLTPRHGLNGTAVLKSWLRRISVFNLDGT